MLRATLGGAMTDRYKPPSQKVSTPVILVDPATGEAYDSGNPIPVAATVEPPEGGATEDKQDDIIVALGEIDAVLDAVAAALAGTLAVAGTVAIDQSVFGTTNAVYIAGVNSGAGNLGKLEDSASGNGDLGVAVFAVRQDTLASSVDADGDYGTLKFDALGRLWVTGTWLEDAQHASGAQGHFVLAVRNDARTALAGTDLDYIGLTTDAVGGLWVAGAQTVDSAAGGTDRVVAAGFIRDDALAALTPVDGDYANGRVDKWGRLHVRESLDEYETVAASQSTQTLGATGAAGDILAAVLIVPATTSPGAVAIKDGSNAAITIFAGGAASVATLHPFYVPLGLRSVQGAWQITTGADVSAIGMGEFT